MSKPPGGGEGRQADTLVKSSVRRGTANAVSALCVYVCVCTRPRSMFSSRNTRDARRVGEQEGGGQNGQRLGSGVGSESGVCISSIFSLLSHGEADGL